MNKHIKYFIVAILAVTVFSWLLTVRPAGSNNTVVYADTTPPDPTTTPAPTTPTPNPLLADIKEALVLYETEEISVDVTKSGLQVYYAIVKSASETGAKVADLIPAAQNSSGMKYIIDISALSATKDIFIGITTSITPDATTGLVPIMVVPVYANQKKIVFNVNWAYEGTPNSFQGKSILDNVVVTQADGSIITYKHITAETATVKNIDAGTFQIQWRKGANTAWKDLSSMVYTDWQSMKASGAIIYFRLDAKNQTDRDKGCRYSKENKLKVAVTKAPSIKIDVSKLTLALKNGIQFRQHSTTGNKWYTLLPYSNKSTNTVALRDTTLSTLFDPYTENTAAKVSLLSIADIEKTLSYIETPAVDSAANLVLDVRMAATTKKPASRIGTVTIPAQAVAPTVSAFTKTSEGYTFGTITATDKLIATPAFEFCVVRKADITGKLINMSTLKWSSAKTGQKLKSTIKGSYVLTDNAKTKVTCNITDTNMCILVRRKGIAGSSKAAAVMASLYCVIDVPTVVVTPSPTPTATPTTAPTP